MNENTEDHFSKRLAPSRPQLFGLLAGLFLASGLILSSMVVTRAWLKISESQTITVTGSARKNVRSDLIIWTGTFSAEAKTILMAQQSLKRDLVKVCSFFDSKGIRDYKLSSITIQELKNRPNENADSQQTVGYRLSQSLEIRSSEVDKIEQLDRESSQLVEEGIAFTTSPSKYIFTKSADLKVEMLAEATKDARARAEQVAGQGGRSIFHLHSARMGVYQITPIYSTDVSGFGVNDETTLEKTVTAVVSASFSLK